jgi:hypothetical protein
MRWRPPTADDVRTIRRAAVPASEAQKLGKARQVCDAAMRSGWDDYPGAIAAAREGNVSRLVDCLRGRKPLTDADRDRLAAYIATKVRRRRWPPELVRALSKPPTLVTEDDYDLLADIVERTGRRPGGMFDEPAHRAARLAEVLLSLMPGRVSGAIRTALIERACEIEGDDIGVEIDPERVRNLLDHKRARAHKR